MASKDYSASNGLPTDPVWLDAMDFSNGKLMIGYDDSGGFAIISTRGTITGQASVQQVGTPVTSVKHTGTEWLIGQAGEASGYSRVDKLGTSGCTPHSNFQRLSVETFLPWFRTVPRFGLVQNRRPEDKETEEAKVQRASFKVHSTQTVVSIGRKVGRSHSQQPLATC